MPLSFSPHIAIQVVDLQEAVELYVETFEAELVERTDAEVLPALSTASPASR